MDEDKTIWEIISDITPPKLQQQVVDIIKKRNGTRAKSGSWGIDAFTFSAVNRKADHWIHARHRGIISILEGEGHKVEEVTIMGYTGVRAGSFFLGGRGDDTIYIAKGAEAGRFYSWFQQDYGVTCTRLDLEITLDFEEKYGEAQGRAAEAMALWKKQSVEGKPYNVEYRDNHGNGDTLYLGRRSSQRFGRVYDKHKEAGLLDGSPCWRWEVELKKELAFRTWTQFLTSQNDARLIQSVVVVAFDHWGIDLPVKFDEIEWVDLRESRSKTKDEETLAWIEKAVVPAIKRLLKSKIANQTQDVIMEAMDTYYEMDRHRDNEVDDIPF